MNLVENGFYLQPDMGDLAYEEWLNKHYESGPFFEDGHKDWHMTDPAPEFDPPGLENLAPITMTTVTFRDWFLIMKRTGNVDDAKFVWSIVNGYIDNVDLTAKQHAIVEIEEETGIQVDEGQVLVGERYILRSPQEKRPYIITPVLARLSEDVPKNRRTGMPIINLNKKPVKENSIAKWIKRPELRGFKRLADLDNHIDKALALNFGNEVVLELP